MTIVTWRQIVRAARGVPRDRFVRPEDRALAGRDEPLLIGHGQTISQPSLVLRMTYLLMAGLERGGHVLEVGTGSGYQTALLARLGGFEVWSIERIAPLSALAAEHLSQIGLNDVHLVLGDGHAGYPPAAPYCAIMVTAAADEIPPALVEQLAPGGRMVIPVSRAPQARPGDQTLLRVTRTPTDLTIETFGAVRFVPLVHGC